MEPALTKYNARQYLCNDKFKTPKSVKETELALFLALLEEVDEINALKPDLNLYLAYIDDEDSTDYGRIRIKSSLAPKYECIGIPMDVKILDYALCAIHDTVELLTTGTIS